MLDSKLPFARLNLVDMKFLGEVDILGSLLYVELIKLYLFFILIC